MLVNELGKVCTSQLRGWSYTAKECYKIGCNCKKCTMPVLLEELPRCQMKAVVLELVKIFGAPEICNKPTMIIKDT